MKWKNITAGDAPCGQTVLLRESQSFNGNVSYYAGVLSLDHDDRLWIRDYHGNRIPLRDDFTYQCIEVNEIT